MVVGGKHPAKAWENPYTGSTINNEPSLHVFLSTIVLCPVVSSRLLTSVSAGLCHVECSVALRELRFRRERTAADVRGQFNTLLRDAGLIPRDRDQLAELNRHSE